MCNNRKIFLFLVWNLYFFSSLSAPIISKKIVSLSIPKSGSHLLAKCLELITHNTMYSFFPKNLSVGNIHALLTNAEYGSIAFSHLEYKAEYSLLASNYDFSLFFIYRDPRDQIISMVHHLLLWHDHAKWPDIKKYSFDELIFEFIKPRKAIIPRPPNHQGILEFYQRFIGWIFCDGICAIKFEDLVGDAGGGSDLAQFTILAKIMNILSISCSKEHISYLSQNMYGGTSTFRNGKIGQWKEYFTPEHKKEFKQQAGQLLIDLGYEENFDW